MSLASGASAASASTVAAALVATRPEIGCGWGWTWVAWGRLGKMVGKGGEMVGSVASWCWDRVVVRAALSRSEDARGARERWGRDDAAVRMVCGWLGLCGGELKWNVGDGEA